MMGALGKLRCWRRVRIAASKSPYSLLRFWRKCDAVAVWVDRAFDDFAGTRVLGGFAPIVSENIFTEKLTLQPNEKINSQTIALKDNLYRLVLNIKLLTSKGFALNLMKNGDEASILTYDVATETLSFDRKKSGKTDFNERFKTIESMRVIPKNGQLKLDILVDKSIVEIYANDGEKVLTDIVFPTKGKGSVEIIWK